MASCSRASRPRSHRDESQPQEEATAQDMERHNSSGRVGLTMCPTKGLGPQAARRPHRRVRATASPWGPLLGAPMPGTRGHPRLIHHRGQPTRTHIGSKRPKRPRVRRCSIRAPDECRAAPGTGPTHPQPRASQDKHRLCVSWEGDQSSTQPCPADQTSSGRGQQEAPSAGATVLQDLRALPGHAGATGSHSGHCPPHLHSGWTHDRQMGSSGELSQLDQDADLLEGADTARLPEVLLEERPVEGDKTPFSPGHGPFFYIGGSNGASIISNYCESKGWQRTQDGQREDYKLKWCEIKCKDSYSSFREGQQLLFQLPNNKLLTTKIGLLSALREHARIMSKTIKMQAGLQSRALKMEDFFPETYRLDIREERQAFFTLFDETQIWICKPTASNQGKGIFLIRSQEEIITLQAKTQSIEEDPAYRKMPFRMPQARVVQRYIHNPLLLEGKKFDVRSYLLIACAMPYMVFFGHGYARLTLSLYDSASSDLSGHLTNQFMQKKSPLYMMLKEGTVWSMDRLNSYINDKFRKTKGLPRDWVFTTFTKRMQQIMSHCFLAVKSKLECKLGYFDLIGCDFLIDENFKVWLLEMNSNPALHTNCEVLKEVIPRVVMETLDLALETFQKSLHGQKMLPLRAQRRFVLLHNGEADLWPRLGGSRTLPRLAPPRAAAGEGSPGAGRADRRGARRPAPPRGAPGRPLSAPRPSRPPGPGEPAAPDPERPLEGRGDPDPEPDPEPDPSARPPEEEREEEPRGSSHRGS
ncbi:inactive polyglycylase TTLL10 [Perognathus longimembris pacificus]|uniref:inactive polyglycylase TTLL10 n=1 Tax=Perognathus longimembris pacificus TaxID=214514 RepID=UPI002019B36C|nr:inactive polyglycylase TTLL10 [Perognathus longimembris pacificus]